MPPSSRPPRVRSSRWGRALAVALAIMAVLAVGVSAFALQRQSVAVAAVGSTPGYQPVAPDTRPVVAFIGDSYTQGVGSTTQTKRWTDLVSKAEGWREANFGRGGTGYVTTATYSGCGLAYCPPYDEMINRVAAVKPSIIVVAGGQNDFGAFAEAPQPVVAAINNLYSQLRTRFPDARIIVIGPSTPGAVNDTVRQMSSAINSAADSINAQFVGLIDPSVLAGNGLLAADGVHPNDEGHAAIAARVVAGIDAAR